MSDDLVEGKTSTGYTRQVPASNPPSLRTEQTRQTRAALVTAARSLFGERGYAATSVEDIAATARVTIGALYHHFHNKAALFEQVFEEIHRELLVVASAAGRGARGTEVLAAGFDAFLDAMLEPPLRRILITDAPFVLGLERFVELDERLALDAVIAVLAIEGRTSPADAEDRRVLARLLLGALTRGGMLIAASDDERAARDSVARSLRVLLSGVTGRR